METIVPDMHFIFFVGIHHQILILERSGWEADCAPLERVTCKGDLCVVYLYSSRCGSSAGWKDSLWLEGSVALAPDVDNEQREKKVVRHRCEQ